MGNFPIELCGRLRALTSSTAVCGEAHESAAGERVAAFADRSGHHLVVIPAAVVLHGLGAVFCRGTWSSGSLRSLSLGRAGKGVGFALARRAAFWPLTVR